MARRVIGDGTEALRLLAKHTLRRYPMTWLTEGDLVGYGMLHLLERGYGMRGATWKQMAEYGMLVAIRTLSPIVSSYQRPKGVVQLDRPLSDETDTTYMDVLKEVIDAESAGMIERVTDAVKVARMLPDMPETLRTAVCLQFGIDSDVPLAPAEVAVAMGVPSRFVYRLQADGIDWLRARMGEPVECRGPDVVEERVAAPIDEFLREWRKTG